jgi:hypothetical protein
VVVVNTDQRQRTVTVVDLVSAEPGNLDAWGQTTVIERLLANARGRLFVHAHQSEF